MVGSKKGAVIHFNSKLPISCNIRTDHVENFFTVELPDGVKLGISKGDPVVVGFMTEEGINAIGGCIVGATAKDAFLKTLLILSDTRQAAVERRKAARISTSLYGIVSRNNIVVSDVCIRDISEVGIGIQSEIAFEIDDQVEIDVILREEVGKFKCSVVRKTKRYNKQEYGLAIIHDEGSLPVLQKFINSIRDYHMEMMSIL